MARRCRPRTQSSIDCLQLVCFGTCFGQPLFIAIALTPPSTISTAVKVLVGVGLAAVLIAIGGIVFVVRLRRRQRGGRHFVPQMDVALPRVDVVTTAATDRDRDPSPV